MDHLVLYSFRCFMIFALILLQSILEFLFARHCDFLKIIAITLHPSSEIVQLTKPYLPSEPQVGAIAILVVVSGFYSEAATKRAARSKV